MLLLLLLTTTNSTFRSGFIHLFMLFFSIVVSVYATVWKYFYELVHAVFQYSGVCVYATI